MVSKPLGVVLQLGALFLVFSAYGSWVDGDSNGAFMKFIFAIALVFVGASTKDRQKN